MDPSLVTAGIGIVGSLLGGKPKTPGYVKEAYQLQNKAARAAQGLYDSTDLEKQDAETLGLYSDATMKQAMALLNNYDATRLGAGGRVGGVDTQANRARTQIASDAGGKVASLGAELSSTRPQRKASLLPNVAAAGAGFQSGAYLDQSERLRQQAELEGLMQLGGLVAGLIKKPGAAGSSYVGPRNQALSWYDIDTSRVGN